MSEKLVIGPSIWQWQTGEDFTAYIASLRQYRESKASKAVPDVTISWGARVTVRIARELKQLTEAEVAALAAEAGKESAELVALLTKRKIAIVNAEGKQTNASERKQRKSAVRSKAKTDAGAIEAT